MKNAFKITLAALVTAAVALPALSAEKSLAVAVENAATRATAKYTLTTDSPLEAFNWKIHNLAKPETAPLMEILQILTAYNQTFETEKDIKELRKLAAKLEGPIAVAWNTYRGNGLKEIFDNYVPNSHGNKELAKLEYYVKLYTVPQKIQEMTYLVSKVLPADFAAAYAELKDTLAAQTQRNDKELLEALAHFALAYNQLDLQDGIVAREVKTFLFKMPIQTGWDRTFSVRELVLQLGIKNDGDGFTFRSAEYIQNKTGANHSDIEVFMHFVRMVLW